MRSYYLADTKLRARFDQLSGSESLETVKDEVILLRTLINERLNFARSESDKIVAFQTIHPALSTLNKLVESLGKLERQTNVVLGKGALNKLSDTIVQILIEELCDIEDYESIIDRVASRIASEIAGARNED
jgi:signal transduction histidine kinase